jgi:hypothetical protein
MWLLKVSLSVAEPVLTLLYIFLDAALNTTVGAQAGSGMIYLNVFCDRNDLWTWQNLKGQIHQMESDGNGKIE